MQSTNFYTGYQTRPRCFEGVRRYERELCIRSNRFFSLTRICTRSMHAPDRRPSRSKQGSFSLGRRQITGLLASADDKEMMRQA
jgi:hypothetical protein